MGKITLSLTDEIEGDLRNLAKENMRSISKEVGFLVKKEVKNLEKGGSRKKYT